MQRLLESPEYQAMRQETMLHETCSEIAALSIAKQFAALRVERNADEQGSPPPGPNGQPGNIQGEVKMIRAVAEAVNEAAEKVSEVREAEAMVGHGPGAESKLSAASIGKLVSRVRHSARLKRICELAGRYRRLAQSKQQAKQTHGYDDMVGVQLDGDVGRLVPTELAQLFDEDLELDAMRRIVERQAMCWEYRGVDQSAKGPIIVMVDESGSMSRHGKIEMAKALALALAYIARTQQRWCALVGWSSAGMVNSLALPPGAWNELYVLAWLEHFYDSGTDVPLDDMPAIYAQTKAPVGKTDVILITDDAVNIDDQGRDRFLAWKVASKTRMITLVIGGARQGDMATVSDEVHQINNLDVNEDAVSRVLSI